MSRGGFTLGKILGIEITVDYSWFIIFFIVTWSLSFGYFPSVYSEFSNNTNIILGIFTSVLFFASALIHELSHSVIAKRNGLDVKKISFFIFGGVAHISEEPKTAGIEFKMAIADPLSSLILAVTFYLLYYFFITYTAILELMPIFQTLAFLNFTLAIFNLLPGFPLDGGRVLRSVIWAINHSLKKATYYASIGGKFIASLLIVGGILETFIIRSLGGIWLVLVGFFFYQAAGISYRQMIFRELLSKIKVRDLMNHEEDFIPLHLKISDLFLRFLQHHKSNFLVIDNGNNIIGSINSNQLSGINEERIKDLEVKDVMTKIDLIKSSVDPQDSMTKAFDIMNENSLSKLPVLKERRFMGTISINDIDEYLKMKLKIPNNT
ncbi:hypothetical protein COZ97_01280 [bacterium CG_4_8_14_3_um_filter_33_28]|nr:MAG: hypothetical protein COZ97_01280 [bacterium CG_4_8_14_3_um_filter_33_28]